MPRRGISGVVGFAGQVFDVEAPGKSALSESEQPRIGYLVQRSVTKDFNQWFVISDHNMIVTTMGEVAGLFKAQATARVSPSMAA